MTDQLPSGLRLPTGASAGAEPLTIDREARREQLQRWDGVGPWGGQVTITAVHMRGRRSGRLGAGRTYEVGVQWTGPPMHGAPPADGPVQSADAWWTEDGQLAEQVARRAIAELRGPHVPNLPELAELARRRA